MTDGTAQKRPRRTQHEAFIQDPAKLRRRRVAAGYSLSALHRLTGISKGHLSEIENPERKRSASPALLVRLAQALGCEVTDLMPDEDAA